MQPPRGLLRRRLRHLGAACCIAACSRVGPRVGRWLCRLRMTCFATCATLAAWGHLRVRTSLGGRRRLVGACWGRRWFLERHGRRCLCRGISGGWWGPLRILPSSLGRRWLQEVSRRERWRLLQRHWWWRPCLWGEVEVHRRRFERKHRGT